MVPHTEGRQSPGAVVFQARVARLQIKSAECGGRVWPRPLGVEAVAAQMEADSLFQTCPDSERRSVGCRRTFGAPSHPISARTREFCKWVTSTEDAVHRLNEAVPATVNALPLCAQSRINACSSIDAFGLKCYK